MSRLELKNVSLSFGGVKAVQNFSMTAEEGQIIGIIGPNGAGKTTIFNVISGVYTADSGQIFLDGEEITRLAQHKIALKGISRTFQNIRLFHGLNCLENVQTTLDSCSNYNLLDALLLTPRRRREEKRTRLRALEELQWVGLGDYVLENPENLSYGLQRKLEIARALAADPKVLLLDEPAAGLNPREVQELTKLILRIREERGMTILLIEHRLELVMSISEVIYVQDFGQTIAVGSSAEVQQNPEVIRAYLGDEEE